MYLASVITTGGAFEIELQVGLSDQRKCHYHHPSYDSLSEATFRSSNLQGYVVDHVGVLRTTLSLNKGAWRLEVQVCDLVHIRT